MSDYEILNLENAANTPIIKDLKALLQSLSVKDLRFIGHFYHLKNLGNKVKKNLVEIIYQTLVDKDQLSQIIERLIDREYQLLKDIMKNKGIIQNNFLDMKDYHFLYMVGIVFLFQRNHKFYVSMPDDVYQALSQVDFDQFESIVSENSKVYRLAQAAVEVYGIISFGDFLSLYHKYYGESDDILLNSLFCCERPDSLVPYYRDHELFFTHEILLDDTFELLREEIIERQQEIPFKEWNLSQLLKFSDSNYYEIGKEKEMLKKYLCQKGASSDDIEKIILVLSNMCKLGHEAVSAGLSLLEDFKIDISKKELKTVLDLLVNFYNHSIVWRNCGWTPVELGKK